MKEIEDQIGESIDWQQVRGVLSDPQCYYPTRLEYFAGKALQGIVTGRATKDYKSCIKACVELAKQLEQEIDAFTATQD